MACGQFNEKSRKIKIKNKFSLNFLRIIAPFFESGASLLDRFYFRDTTDLAGDLDTALRGLEPGHQPGHVSAAHPGLQVTLLNRGVSLHSLDLGVALWGAL